MNLKSKLVGNLINCIYFHVEDEEVRYNVYSEFVADLLDKDFPDISFLDECTDDPVFWDVMTEYNMCVPHEDDEKLSDLRVEASLDDDGESEAQYDSFLEFGDDD